MNCEQVRQLLYFYFYDEINNPEIEEEISQHLEDCDDCYNFYEDLLIEIQENQNIENISAYIDNELSDKDCIKMKKNIILNQKTRSEFERFYSLHNLIKNFFSKNKNDIKEDYSKLIFRKLNLMDEVYGKNIFPEIAGIFVVIFVGLFLATVAIFGI